MDPEIISWLVWTSVPLLMALVVFSLLRRNTKSQKRLPPGPRPLPVLGNIGDMDALSHQKFAKLSKQYGPLINMYLGAVPFIVANNAELAKEILKTKDFIFASRPDTTTLRELGYNQNAMSTSPLGPKWRTLRKMFVGELLSPTCINDFKEVREYEVLTLLRVLLEESRDGQPTQIGVRLKDHIGNVVTSLIMNKRLFGPHADDATDSVKFQDMIARVVDLVAVLHIGDYIPLFKNLDIQGNKKKMRAAHSRVDTFLQRIIDNRREEIKQGERTKARTDFLDVMLARSGENDEYALNEVNFKAIMQETIPAGVLSSASAVEWTLAELVKHPETMRKAQEELDSVVGRERLVEESDVPNLPYLSAVLKESFRLHPVTPLLIPHMVTEDCVVAGFDIPAQSQVCVNLWAIGRDPEVWENPSEFSPERFLDSPLDVSGRYFELLAFGSGRRRCPGYGLAMIMVQYFIAVLVHGCQFTTPPGQRPEDLDMAEYCGMVSHKAIPLEVILTPRLPKHVIYVNTPVESFIDNCRCVKTIGLMLD